MAHSSLQSPWKKWIKDAALNVQHRHKKMSLLFSQLGK